MNGRSVRDPAEDEEPVSSSTLRLRAWQVLAALLLVVAAVLAHHLYQLSEPVNVRVVSLRPQPQPASDAEALLVEAEAADGCVLILSTRSGPDPSRQFELEVDQLLGRQVHLLWRQAGLQPDRSGRFALRLPGGFLEPEGRYRLRLIGRQAGAQALIEQYQFQVAARREVP